MSDENPIESKTPSADAPPGDQLSEEELSKASGGSGGPIPYLNFTLKTVTVSKVSLGGQNGTDPAE